MNRAARHLLFPIVLILPVVVAAALTGCREDDPVAPPVEPIEPQASIITVLSPRANDVFDLKPTIVVTWDTVAAVTSSDSIYLDYRPAGTSKDWRTLQRLPVMERSASFGVGDTAVTVFEIRLKASRETDWHIISPLYIRKPVFAVLFPKSGDAVEIGRTLQFRWTSDTQGVPDSL